MTLFGSNLTVRGNYIGTNAAGTAALGNGIYGIRGYGESDSEIGGPAAADGNVIAGNVRGVSFEQGATGNLMRNNILGLDATGTVNLADNSTGIEITSPGNTIGAPGAGNVIAGFTYQGITLSGAATTGNLIQGNWIGTNPALAGGLGNAQLGIYVLDAAGNKIGGTAAGEGNVIANNGFIGLWVEHGDRNEISGNSIFGNALLGIDIGEQGIAPNDGGDGDGGGNRRQNYPLISSAVVSGGATERPGPADQRAEHRVSRRVLLQPGLQRDRLRRRAHLPRLDPGHHRRRRAGDARDLDPAGDRRPVPHRDGHRSARQHLGVLALRRGRRGESRQVPVLPQRGALLRRRAPDRRRCDHPQPRALAGTATVDFTSTDGTADRRPATTPTPTRRSPSRPGRSSRW